MVLVSRVSHRYSYCVFQCFSFLSRCVLMLRPSRCCILNVYDCLVLKLQVICPLSNLHETNCIQSLRAGMVNQRIDPVCSCPPGPESPRFQLSLCFSATPSLTYPVSSFCFQEVLIMKCCVSLTWQSPGSTQDSC